MTSAADPDFAARETLRLIGPDPQNWVPDRAGVDHNVLVVGGGQTGATFAFALRRAGIGKVAVIDAAPKVKTARKIVLGGDVISSGGPNLPKVLAALPATSMPARCGLRRNPWLRNRP